MNWRSGRAAVSCATIARAALISPRLTAWIMTAGRDMSRDTPGAGPIRSRSARNTLRRIPGTASLTLRSGWLITQSTWAWPDVRRTGCKPRTTTWTSHARTARSSAWSSVCTCATWPSLRNDRANACARCQSPQRGATLADGAATVNAMRSAPGGNGDAACSSSLPSASL